jgi:sarcosine oxidase
MYDVAIIGLGAMGSAAAWHLARRGLRVIGFDLHTPPHPFGSTHGHSRIIREAYYEHPLYVPLVQRAYAIWREIEAESGESLLQVTGGVMIGAADSALVRGAEASTRQHQLPSALWPAHELRTRVPAFRMPDDFVAVWEPRAGMLRPEAAVETMLASARRHGAELLCDTPVTGWKHDDSSVIVATAAHDYRARRAIVTAGAWIGRLLPHTRLPVIVERAVQFWFDPGPDPDLHRPGRLPIFIVDAGGGQYFYGLPDQGHGVKLAAHHGGETTTADTVRRVVDERECEAMRAVARTWLPGLGRLVDQSVCLYTNTPDGHFVIDRVPDRPSVVLASPCSGHGFKFAPVIGEVLADMVMDRTPAFDLAPFRLSRF